jgi:hypothetical protein
MVDEKIRDHICRTELGSGHRFATFCKEIWDAKAGRLVQADHEIICTACGGSREELSKKTRVAKPRTAAAKSVPAQQEAQPENQEAQSSFVAPPPSGTEENLEQLDQS